MKKEISSFSNSTASLKNQLLIGLLLLPLLSFITIESLIIVNRDKTTRGLTKIHFYEVNGRNYAKIWASCAPKDCFWGTFEVNNVSKYHHYELLRANPNLTFLPAYETIKVNQSHAVRKISIDKHRKNGYYRIVMKTDYNNPSKDDTQKTYVFDKQ